MIDRVSKRYKGSDSYALRDLTLDIGPGILGLLGPNGAGKSTLMRIIATITRPTHGKVYWNGSDISLNSRMRYGLCWATYPKTLGFTPT